MKLNIGFVSKYTTQMLKCLRVRQRGEAAVASVAFPVLFVFPDRIYLPLHYVFILGCIEDGFLVNGPRPLPNQYLTASSVYNDKYVQLLLKSRV